MKGLQIMVYNALAMLYRDHTGQGVTIGHGVSWPYGAGITLDFQMIISHIPVEPVNCGIAGFTGLWGLNRKVDTKK